MTELVKHMVYNRLISLHIWSRALTEQNFDEWIDLDLTSKILMSRL